MTFRDLNGYLLWLLGGMCGVIVVIVTATAYLHHNMVTRDEFSAHVAQQNRWQDRIETALMSRGTVSFDGQRVYQVMLVELPDSIETQQMKERERLRAELVREQLASNREANDGLQ